jgi:RNA polymerase sigma-70 factor (ECF subfamily)
MPDHATDEALVAATLGGDEGAFAELVGRHKKRVFGTASRFARDTHQLDDLAQEIFLRAFRHLGKFRGDAPFEHWLARLAVSACYDFLRRERRVREQTSLDALAIEFHDPAPDAERSATAAREVLGHAMRQLSADEQLILTLCELEERSIRETSQLTGWSEANVKVRGFRARERLRKILKQTDDR